jgi:hypothetical protein
LIQLIRIGPQIGDDDVTKLPICELLGRAIWQLHRTDGDKSDDGLVESGKIAQTKPEI